MDPVSKGPDPGRTGSKSTGNRPYQALRTLAALDPGYLDLSNTCPWGARKASGYRAGTAEDTGTMSGKLTAGYHWPGGNQGH